MTVWHAPNNAPEEMKRKRIINTRVTERHYQQVMEYSKKMYTPIPFIIIKLLKEGGIITD
jgi:hypothetical protein